MSANSVLQVLKNENPDLIILAGFLWKFPELILKEFPNKVINLHPALLPKYGGKGMYGHHVHEAVIENKEKETGITFHYVNENYDEGAIIFQKSVGLDSNETLDSVAKKIHELEYAYFPKVIEGLLFPEHQYERIEVQTMDGRLITTIPLSQNKLNYTWSSKYRSGLFYIRIFGKYNIKTQKIEIIN